MELTENQMREIEKVKETAADYYKSGQYGCAEAILIAVNDYFGKIIPSDAVTIVSGLNGGIGFHGSTCGSLIGGVIALGLNPHHVDPAANRKPVAKMSRKFFREFEAKYQNTFCSLLTESVEMGSPEQMEFCTSIVIDTTETVLKKLLSANS